jgi:hypothetical protein
MTLANGEGRQELESRAGRVLFLLAIPKFEFPGKWDRVSVRAESVGRIMESLYESKSAAIKLAIRTTEKCYEA